MDVSIIVVNYNKYEDTIACVESLLNMHSRHFADIIIVDNCSTNDSYNILKEHFKDLRITLLYADENRGYCAGNNIGIAYAQQNVIPNYYWILNPDTIVDSMAMTALIEFAENHDDAGLIGSKLIYYPDNDRIQALGGGYINKKFGIISFTHIFHGDIVTKKLPAYIELDLLIGASFFIKKEVIEMIGLMNESYFLYCDENEYCLRAKHNGWKLYGVSSSIVWHKEGWRKQEQKCWSQYYTVRNSLFLIQRYYQKYIYINILYKFYISFRLLCGIFLLRQNSFIMFLYTVQGIFDFLINKKGKVIKNIK